MTNANDLVQFSLDSSLANGLTKREYFAAMAMQCFVESEMKDGLTFEEVAERCVLQADALITALNPNP